MRFHAQCRMLAALLALAFCQAAGAMPPFPSMDEHADVKMMTAKARAVRERTMQVAWRGRSYHALLVDFGPPRSIMSHPARPEQGTRIVIYGVRDAISNCIDAFTVFVPDQGREEVVDNYFCR